MTKPKTHHRPRAPKSTLAAGAKAATTHLATSTDPRVAETLRIVGVLVDTSDPEGLNCIIENAATFGGHSKAQIMATFAAMLRHGPSTAVGRLHLAALAQERINSKMRTDLALSDGAQEFVREMKALREVDPEGFSELLDTARQMAAANRALASRSDR